MAETRLRTNETGAPTFTVRDGAAALGQLRGPADSGGEPSVDYWNVLLPSGTPIGRFVDGSSNDRRYYHTDHLGSTRAVTDQSGTVVERRDHYPFGLQMPGRTLAQGPRAPTRTTPATNSTRRPACTMPAPAST
ncbi:hypothetical protein [Longimonas halophila]|uniref:hypothetical protein n=1 Tax=Longimonas halophila TaxID=1469170 RepID=UPI001143DE0B|nr:hypothetical protein [Longimonas halophila]